MKRLIPILCLILFLSLPITAYAKERNIKSCDFTQLRDEDMQDTINTLTTKIANDCGVEHTIYTSCYDWEESPILAYNTLITYTICVNLTGFRTTTDADAANETVEYHLVKTIAHEVRHSYQYEHRLDGTEYGNSCFQGFADYQSYNGNRESYYAQFIEADAVQWAIEYANNYFKR